MAYIINDSCISCGACAAACPMTCIKMNDEETQFIIEEDNCISCGTCAAVCPVAAPQAD